MTKTNVASLSCSTQHLRGAPRAKSVFVVTGTSTDGATWIVAIYPTREEADRRASRLQFLVDFYDAQIPDKVYQEDPEFWKGFNAAIETALETAAARDGNDEHARLKATYTVSLAPPAWSNPRREWKLDTCAAHTGRQDRASLEWIARQYEIHTFGKPDLDDDSPEFWAGFNARIEQALYDRGVRDSRGKRKHFKPAYATGWQAAQAA